MPTQIEITSPLQFVVEINRSIHLADEDGNESDAYERFIVLKDKGKTYKFFWEALELASRKPALEEGKIYTFRINDTKIEGRRQFELQQIRDGKMILFSAPLEVK